MKRVLLSTVGTIAGLVALLSFKTHGPVATGALPSAGLPDASTSPSTTPSSSSTRKTTTKKSTAARSTTRSTASSAPAATTKDYLGSAITTQYGVVQVKVTVSGHTIKNVSFVQLTAFDGTSQQINSQAAPILLQETLTAQSSQIDTVSGASYTSAGYVQSLQSALDQADIK